LLQRLVADVSSRYPHHLRRRAAVLNELNEILILCNHRRNVGRASRLEDWSVVGGEEAELKNVSRVNVILSAEPHGQRWGQLCIDPDAERRSRSLGWLSHLSRDCRMIQAPRRVEQAGGNVVGLEIWELLEDLLVGLPSRQQLENVDDPNPHTANARPAAALLRADSYAL
jgi:hypothetical protein